MGPLPTCHMCPVVRSNPPQHQQHHHHVGSPALREAGGLQDVHHQPLLLNPHQMVPSPMSSHYGSNPLHFQAQRTNKRPRLDGETATKMTIVWISILECSNRTPIRKALHRRLMLSAHGEQQRAAAHFCAATAHTPATVATTPSSSVTKPSSHAYNATARWRRQFNSCTFRLAKRGGTSRHA